VVCFEDLVGVWKMEIKYVVVLTLVMVVVKEFEVGGIEEYCVV